MDNEMFPVYYDGKMYKEEECDDVFLAFYNCIEDLNHIGGVYLSNGDWIYPDGSISQF